MNVDTGTTGLIIGILTFLGGLISIISSRRTRKADTDKSLAGIIESLSSNISKLQKENQTYYESIVTLKNEKEKLENRLEDKDSQLRIVTTQLETYQSRERQMRELRELTEQLEATMKVAEEYRIIIADKDKAINALKAKTGPLPPLERYENK